MLPNLFQSLKNIAAPFSLKDLAGFPYTDWSDKVTEYEELEEWFNGDALDETQELGDKKVDLYPLKLNPIHGAVLKHAYALFGEFPEDTSGSLVINRAIVQTESDGELAKAIEDALFKVWYENNGTALQLENGIASQVYGGCIFKVSWTPADQERPIRIEKIEPAEFVGIPYSNDPWRLKKAWVVRKITAETAEEYGVTVPGEYAWYIEFWTPDEYQILINDSPIVYDALGAEHIYGGDNPFHFVPFVYIPHERAGEFYGKSLITESVQGIVKEMNLRIADAGDATNDQSHSILVMRNVRGMPQITKLSNTLSVLNLGSGQSISGNDVQPDLFSVTRSMVTEPMLRLNDELQNQFRREVMVPAVAEGEDEGSQRSAVTLSARMYPLLAHIKSERALWTAGLITLNKMILQIMAAKGINEITKQHLKMSLKVKWHPVLPRDRQAFVEELVARAGVNLGSPEHLLGLIGDVEDIDTTMAQIKEWLEFQSDLQAQVFERQAESQAKAQGQSQAAGGRQPKAVSQSGREPQRK